MASENTASRERDHRKFQMGNKICKMFWKQIPLREIPIDLKFMFS